MIEPPIIISMTSIPSRNGTLGPTLDSLFAQTIQFTELRIYLTPGCEGPTGLPSNVRCLWVDDCGPITKLSAAIDPELPPDTSILTVDDDIIYAPTWLATLFTRRSERIGAVGFSGWDTDHFRAGTGTFHFVRPPNTCDVIEGWSGVLYRRDFFEADVMQIPEEFRWVDDVWISSYLHRRGIPRTVIARPMAASTPGRPGLHTREDFIELNRRAAIKGFT